MVLLWTDFQLTYARKAWMAEKEAWRAVIHLNLVRSVNAIAAAVAATSKRERRYSSKISEAARWYPLFDRKSARAAALGVMQRKNSSLTLTQHTATV